MGCHQLGDLALPAIGVLQDAQALPPPILINLAAPNFLEQVQALLVFHHGERHYLAIGTGLFHMFGKGACEPELGTSLGRKLGFLRLGRWRRGMGGWGGGRFVCVLVMLLPQFDATHRKLSTVAIWPIGLNRERGGEGRYLALLDDIVGVGFAEAGALQDV